MRLPTWSPAVARWLPAGVAELAIALYVLGVWFDPSLFGPSTPYDLRFLVVSEASLVGLILLLWVAFQSASQGDRVFWSLCVIGFGGTAFWWLATDAGWLVLPPFALHLATTLRDASKTRVGGVLASPFTPAFLAIGFGVLVANVPLPLLGWSTYAVPADVRTYWPSTAGPVSNWYPATAFLYFLAAAWLAWARRRTTLVADATAGAT